MGAAVERAVEGSNRGGRGGVRIDVRAPDTADGVRRTILFVIGVKDKENVERALQGRVRPVFRLGGAKEHVKKVAWIAELIVWIDIRHAQRVPAGKCRECRNRSTQSIRLLPSRLDAR